MNKTKRITHTLKLIKHLKKYRVGMGLAIFSGIAQHLATIALSALCAYTVGLTMQGALGEQFPRLAKILASLVCLKVLMYYAEMWFAHNVAFKVLADFRNKMFDVIEKVSPAILLHMRSGQLASTLMSDVEVLEWFFAHTFGTILVSIFVPAVVLIFLGTLHVALPLVILFMMSVTIAIPFILRKKADAQGEEVRNALANANAVTIEGIQGMKEILTQNYVEEYNRKNHRHMRKLYEAQYAYGKRLGLEGGVIQGVVGLAGLSVMGLSAWLVLEGAIEFQWFTVAVVLSAGIFAPVLELSNTARNFGLIFACANRIYQVLETKPSVCDSGEFTQVEQLKSDICFSKVGFAYQKEGAAIVENVSFTVREGETVALVGHSGAGKSTCINLLLRYWDVDSGAITIGGRDIREMSLEAQRSLFASVLQENYLFHISIRENIRLSYPRATDDEVKAAAQAAFAHQFISELPQGYDTIVGERGSMLSGGQRQRITIARALLKNAPILVLDEAVSNLDTENEYEIQKALKTSLSEKTTLVVAHRLSTIMMADKVIVLEKGKVVDSGSYEELVTRAGPYQQLFHAQLGE